MVDGEGFGPLPLFDKTKRPAQLVRSEGFEGCFVTLSYLESESLAIPVLNC